MVTAVAIRATVDTTEEIAREMPPGYGNHPAPGYGRLLPNAPNLHPTHFEMWFFLFWAGALVVLVAIPWAIVQLRKGNRMPALALGGGLFCSIQEPMWDHLGHLRWATALPDAFHNFGLDVPVLIPPCYMLFFGLEVYFVYTMVNRGVTVRDFFLIWIACGLTDAIMEHPGLLMHIYEYYGNGGPQPFDFGNKFPFYWSIINSAGFMTGGVIASHIYPKVKGKGVRELVMLVVPPVGMMIGYAGSAWPVFLAINSDMGMAWQWVLGGGGCVALALVYIYFLGDLIAKPEAEIDWNLGKLMRARFMLPHQRERFIAEHQPVTQARAGG